jgi:broad specificity phosphatase PhoE
LGHQQASWLGAHFTQTETHFERVFCGTLRRHLETANGIFPTAEDSFVQDPRLNEMAYFTLAKLFYEQHGIPVPDNRDGFSQHLPRMLTAWASNEIANAPESFISFESRVDAALHDISATGTPAIVVTSGGVIGMIMRLTMELNLTTMSRACLSIMNTSVHHYQPLGPNLTMAHFNGVPHLDMPDRAEAKTYL